MCLYFTPRTSLWTVTVFPDHECAPSSTVLLWLFPTILMPTEQYFLTCKKEQIHLFTWKTSVPKQRGQRPHYLLTYSALKGGERSLPPHYAYNRPLQRRSQKHTCEQDEQNTVWFMTYILFFFLLKGFRLFKIKCLQPLPLFSSPAKFLI